jgi:hypothetical protein
MGRQASIRRARRLGLRVLDTHRSAEQVAAVLEADRVRRPPKYEYLLVAEGSTVAQSAAYLRDMGVQIVETTQRADGRWVIKVLSKTAA